MSLPAEILPETIHPSLWRGSQLARGRDRGIATGHAELDRELPGGVWPQGALTDLLVRQPGIGELRLLVPALAKLGARPIAVVQPPHTVQPVAFSHRGLDAKRLTVLRAPKTADALWATEQVLRTGTFGAVMFWQQYVRPESLRRLHLAAQSGGESVFFPFRPLAAARDTSPAPLRLSLTPADVGISISFVKRRGPARDEPLVVSLSPSPVLLSRHGSLDRRTSAAHRPRVVPTDMVSVLV
ncbi:protein ImuA (plasmid) [Pararobbsia alpina]|uniref:translesion DNA synthesis-associated protein ImuA n=1 Tax=Pararobbsia alpina TaxID=621374 RepID=UPI0039A6C212